MTEYVFGFWGCFFGAAVLMLAGAAFAFTRGLRLIAVNAAASALVSALFVAAFLGGLPIDDAGTRDRCLSVITLGAALLLFYLQLSMLGALRKSGLPQRTKFALAAIALITIVASAKLKSLQGLQLSLAVSGAMALLALGLTMRSAWRGDRLAWMMVFGTSNMLMALAGLGSIALNRANASWQVHVASALASTLYITTTALALWLRYCYLIELREVMAHGPSYDPVTRMRSHSETGLMVGDAFKNYRDKQVPLGMIVLSIGNLFVLQKLYGQAAVNHVLFVCAGRLRRIAPAYVDMGRLADDSFLLLIRNGADALALLELAVAVQTGLSRPVVLHTSLESMATLRHQTRWTAEVGVGVQRVWRADERASKAVAMARGMSRTAWSFPSRVAWYDDDRGEIVGVPLAVTERGPQNR